MGEEETPAIDLAYVSPGSRSLFCVQDVRSLAQPRRPRGDLQLPDVGTSQPRCEPRLNLQAWGSALDCRGQPRLSRYGSTFRPSRPAVLT